MVEVLNPNAPRRRRKVKEATVADHLIKGWLGLGGEYRRLAYIGRKDAPDLRLLLEVIQFHADVETKAPKKGPRKTQKLEHELLRRCGVHCLVIRTIPEADAFLTEVRTKIACRLNTHVR